MNEELPISPFTGEPYDPELGIRINGGERTAQRIVKKALKKQEEERRKQAEKKAKR